MGRDLALQRLILYSGAQEWRAQFIFASTVLVDQLP